MIYSLHPEAAKELEDAFTFYREQGGNELAHAFLAEFERINQALPSNPTLAHPALAADAAIRPGVFRIP